MHRMILACLLASSLLQLPADAHHPDRETRPVRPRIDLLGPLGNHLPSEHRRRLNRPTRWGGKWAYVFAPSSQEAMVWHDAEHRGDYQCQRAAHVPLYFHPKPYDQLNMGARKRAEPSDEGAKGKTGGPDPVQASDEEDSPPQVEELPSPEPSQAESVSDDHQSSSGSSGGASDDSGEDRDELSFGDLLELEPPR